MNKSSDSTDGENATSPASSVSPTNISNLKSYSTDDDTHSDFVNIEARSDFIGNVATFGENESLNQVFSRASASAFGSSAEPSSPPAASEISSAGAPPTSSNNLVPTAPSSLSSLLSTASTRLSSSQGPSAQPTAPLPTAPTPPRWRFVNEAKKKSGYSTSDAGKQVKGLSAEELAANYKLSQHSKPTPRTVNSNEDYVDSYKRGISNDSGGGNDGKDAANIGKVSIPTFLQGGGTSESFSASGGTWRAQAQHLQASQEQLQILQQESQIIQEEQERLRSEVENARKEKEELERDAIQAREEKERLEREADLAKLELERRLKELEEMERKREEEKKAAELRTVTLEEDAVSGEKSELEKKELEVLEAASAASAAANQKLQDRLQDLTNIQEKQAEVQEKEERMQRDLEAVVLRGEENEEKKKEQVVQEADELAAAGAEENTKILSMKENGIQSQKASGENPENTDIESAQNADKVPIEELPSGNGRKRNRSLLIMALIVVVAGVGAAIGIVMSKGDDADTSSSEGISGVELLLDSNKPTMMPTTAKPTVAVVADSSPSPSKGPTNSPVSFISSISATDTAIPTSSPTKSPTSNPMASPTQYPIAFFPHSRTSPPTQTSTERLTTSNSIEEYNPVVVLCPVGTKKIEVKFTFDETPFYMFWAIVDYCTSDVFVSCVNDCSAENQPYTTVSYTGCLPSANTETEVEPGYFFQVTYVDANGNSFIGQNGYEIYFEEELIYESAVNLFVNKDQFFFGGTGGCVDGVDRDTVKPTSSPTATSSSGNSARDTVEEIEPILICPRGSKKFEVYFSFDAKPSEIFWVLIEACTLDLVHSCIDSCYSNMEPYSTTSFTKCLPTTSENNYISYIFQLTDAGGDGMLGGWYAITYGEVVVYTSEGEFTHSEQVNFGGEENGIVNGCVENSDAPTTKPTLNPSSIVFDRKQPTLDPITLANQCLISDDTYVNSNQCFGGAVIVDQLLEPSGDDTSSFYYFGSSSAFVGKDGNIAVVGAGGNNSNSAVHVYHRQEGSVWTHLTSITPEEDSSYVNFGVSVDASEQGYIVIGAPLSDANVLDWGKVYVYEPNDSMTEWALVSVLYPDITQGGYNFGASFGAKVVIDGTTIAVGRIDDRSGTGSVYIFEKMPSSVLWSKAAYFSPEELSPAAQFGTSLSLRNDVLAVGAFLDGDGGSVYVFQKVGLDWISRAKLAPRDVFPGAAFGLSVAVGDCAIFASMKSDTGGSIRIFNYDFMSDYWFHNQIIEAGDQLAGTQFGNCIAVEGNNLLVGAPTGGSEITGGATYKFGLVDGLWEKKQVILNRDPETRDLFGCSLSISGHMALVGAPGDSVLAPNSGSAFVVDLCPSLMP